VSGQVLDRVGRVLHQFSSDLALSARPQANVEIVEVEKDSLSWLIWVSIIGAAVIGGGIAIGVIAQRDLPDVPEGGLGRTPL
jgi:hypothetical protein